MMLFHSDLFVLPLQTDSVASPQSPVPLTAQHSPSVLKQTQHTQTTRPLLFCIPSQKLAILRAVNSSTPATDSLLLPHIIHILRHTTTPSNSLLCSPLSLHSQCLFSRLPLPSPPLSGQPSPTLFSLSLSPHTTSFFSTSANTLQPHAHLLCVRRLQNFLSICRIQLLFHRRPWKTRHCTPTSPSSWTSV